MYTFDHGLFMALNFDGGTALDRVMLTISGTAMWLPLYALILWLVWRRSGWRGMSVFLVLMLLALGLSDIVSGIFKHNGLLGDMLPQFEPRPRPMFTPSLEGLEITPDSLRALKGGVISSMDSLTQVTLNDGLEYLGVKLDAEKNKLRGEEVIISTPDSKVTVWVIPTNEELMIAQDTAELCK